MGLTVIELYNQLMKLCEDSKAFFFKDEKIYNATFRIFGYRYCSYEDWLKPGALECRGIMFEIKPDGTPIRIASRPMEKFFNLHENDLTRDINPNKIVRIMSKIDGSLVSSFVVSGCLLMKSKTTMNSDQALFARNLAYDMGYEFVSEVVKLDSLGFTVNMEYIAPHNRVVIPYQQEKLVVLNVRNKDTGEYLPIKEIKKYPKIWGNFVNGFCTEELTEANAHLIHYDIVRGIEGIEGYIWVMDTGQMVKVKTDWYVAKHKAKDGALNFRYCLEAVLDEKSDDIRAALHDDPAALELLNKVERVVRDYMSDVLGDVEEFHSQNKRLDRKSYAIKAQEYLTGGTFALAMQLYLGQDLSLRKHVEKQYDMLKEECGVIEAKGLEDV